MNNQNFIVQTVISNNSLANWSQVLNGKAEYFNSENEAKDYIKNNNSNIQRVILQKLDENNYKLIFIER